MSSSESDFLFNFWFRGILIGLFFVSAVTAYGCGPIRDGDKFPQIATESTQLPDPSAGSTGETAQKDPFGAPTPPPADAPPADVPPEAPQSPPDAPQQPAPAPAPEGQGAAALASQRLSELGMNDDFGSIPQYDRKKFKHWSDLDGNRCDARQDVLIRQSIGNKAQVDAYGCQVVTGDWYSEYDSFTTTNPGDLDVDHVVALGEGWRAGAWQWDDARREQFANDLGSRQLIAVSAKSNRSKSDKRPDQWMPPRAEFHCQFLFDWVEVKHLWGLTVATSEKNFIGEKLQLC